MAQKRQTGDEHIDTMAYRTRIYEKYASVFKSAAGTFDIHEAEWCGQFYRYYLRNWLPDDKNASILDAGCGSGRLLYFFKKEGYQHIKGIDISPEQINLARQVVADVEQGNALDFLCTHPEQFDLIIALDLVEHLTKDEALLFLERSFAALRPSGRLILETPNGDCPMSSAIRYGDFTHEICFTPESLTKLLQLHGFTQIQAREQGPVPHGLASVGRYLLWKLIRIGIQAFNLIEIGGRGYGVYTRGFLATGTKPCAKSNQ